MDTPIEGRVLLVGEGNFSLSVSLLESGAIAGQQLTSTCLESFPAVQEVHKLAGPNIHLLEKAGGRVLFEVDARDLHSHPEISFFEYQRVIFNFPLADRHNIKKNRALLSDFFSSVKNILDPKQGQVMVTLCKGQGGTPADQPVRSWHDSWQVVSMAANAGLILTQIYSFMAQHFARYQSVGFRFQDKGFNTDDALVHVFEMAGTVPLPFGDLSRRSIQQGNVTFSLPVYIRRKWDKWCLLDKECHPLSILHHHFVSCLSQSYHSNTVLPSNDAHLPRVLSSHRSLLVRLPSLHQDTRMAAVTTSVQMEGTGDFSACANKELKNRQNLEKVAADQVDSHADRQNLDMVVTDQVDSHADRQNLDMVVTDQVDSHADRQNLDMVVTDQVDSHADRQKLDMVVTDQVDSHADRQKLDMVVTDQVDSHADRQNLDMVVTDQVDSHADRQNLDMVVTDQVDSHADRQNLDMVAANQVDSHGDWLTADKDGSLIAAGEQKTTFQHGVEMEGLLTSSWDGGQNLDLDVLSSFSSSVFVLHKVPQTHDQGSATCLYPGPCEAAMEIEESFDDSRSISQVTGETVTSETGASDESSASEECLFHLRCSLLENLSHFDNYRQSKSFKSALMSGTVFHKCPISPYQLPVSHETLFIAESGSKGLDDLANQVCAAVRAVMSDKVAGCVTTESCQHCFVLEEEKRVTVVLNVQVIEDQKPVTLGQVFRVETGVQDTSQARESRALNQCLIGAVLFLDNIAFTALRLPDVRLLWSDDDRFWKQFSPGSNSVALFRSFRPFSLYPVRFVHDISFWENPQCVFDESELLAMVRDVADDTVTRVYLVDRFEHTDTGRTSRCYRLVFQSHDCALSYVASWKLQNVVRMKVAHYLGVTLR